MKVREARRNTKIRLYVSQINHIAPEKKPKNSCSRGSQRYLRSSSSDRKAWSQFGLWMWWLRDGQLLLTMNLLSQWLNTITLSHFMSNTGASSEAPFHLCSLRDSGSFVLWLCTPLGPWSPLHSAGGWGRDHEEGIPPFYPLCPVSDTHQLLHIPLVKTSFMAVPRFKESGNQSPWLGSLIPTTVLHFGRAASMFVS